MDCIPCTPASEINYWNKLLLSPDGYSLETFNKISRIAPGNN